MLCYQQTTASLTVRTLLAVTIVSVGRVSHWVPIKEPASVGVLVILLRGLVLYYKYQNLLFFFFTEEHAQCFPGCINGGVCRGGKCRCPRGFSGGLCQEGMQICILFFIFICTMVDQKLLIHLLL